jgi:hypothetical protein
MPTTRFCSLIGVPERTWRRYQARARAGRRPKGPWPHPARDRVRDAARRHALAHPAWGHRKVWAMCRHDGLLVSAASVLRLLREEGLLLEASYQRERRQLAARRKAAFAVEPTGANQVWQLDFTEFETTTGGTWRLAGCRDYWSKYELGWHISPTANQHDAIAAIELALTEAARLAGRGLHELAARDADGNVLPLITIVRQRRTVPVVPVRGVHRHPPRTASRPHPRPHTGPERLPRARVRDAEVRAAVPRGDRRRPRPDRARRAVPGRLQHRPPARGPVLEPAARRPRRPGRPADPQLSRTRNPANCLTRDLQTLRRLAACLSCLR